MITQKSGLPKQFVITGIRDENSATKTFILNSPLNAAPGQFVMAWLPGMQDKPFSIANADPLSLTIAAVGPLSEALHRLKIGDSIWVRGPLGQGYQLPENPAPDEHILLIGGGYGVAPLHYLATTALAAGYKVSVIIGARSSDGLLLTEAFESLGVSLWLTTEDGSAGLRGVVTDAMSQVFTGSMGKPATVYTCGPTGMLRAVAKVCAVNDVPVQVSWEEHMRCGIGLCGSCEVGEGWLTCLDGPVFPFDPVGVSPTLANNV